MKEDISFLSQQGKDQNQKKKKKSQANNTDLEYTSPEIQEGEALETPGHSDIGSGSTLPSSFDLGSLPEDRIIEAYRINWFNRLLDWWSQRKKKKNTVGPTGPARGNVVSGNPISTEDALINAAAASAAGNDVQGASIPGAGRTPNNLGLNILGSSSVLETNLMEGGVTSFIDWQRHGMILAVALILTVSIVGLAFTGLAYWDNLVKNQVDIAKAQSDALTARLDKVREETKAYGFLGDKILLVNGLLDRHVYWTNFFRFLENDTVSDVYFLSFSGDASGSYKISGYAKRYDDLTRQLESFKADKDNVVNAVITGGKMQGGGEDTSEGSVVAFTLDLTLNNKLFIASPQR